jgi:CRP-like cAMP-binding protein
MPETPSTPPQSPNRILARLSREDVRLLEPGLEAVDLPVRKQLESRNKAIKHVYFLEHGFASVVANGTGRSIEVGLVGREGMTGLAVVMGADRSPNDTYMQVAGDGQRVSPTGAARSRSVWHAGCSWPVIAWTTTRCRSPTSSCP